MKEKVYDFLRTIPKGKVVTYGQIAEYLGNKKLARVVGNILHNNPDEDKYPCYKVVDSKGNLSKQFAFGGIEKQKEKLEKDGIVVINYKVNLDEYKML
ncbi:MAG: MGMT family protein [Bacilli bacterium]